MPTVSVLPASIRSSIPLIAEHLEKVLPASEDYDAFFLKPVERCLSETSATLRCHVLACDPSDSVRIHGLIRHLKSLIIDYCIPKSELHNAIEIYTRNGTTSQLLYLEEKARELFTDLENSGESGELLLFFLATRILRLPPLLCKMHLKTNARMHFHGADGVYVGADQSKGHLCVYFGESKLHGDIDSAASDCFRDLAALLVEPEAPHAKASRDVWLIRDHLDFNDEALETAIKDFLNPAKRERRSLEFRGVALVGFDAPDLAALSLKVEGDVTQLDHHLDKWTSIVRSAVISKNVDRYVLEVFCVPLPAVTGFRDALRETLHL